MISPELLRRYPFFAGLSHDQIVKLAKVGNELPVDAEHYFFHEGETLDCFNLVVEGAVAIVIEVPDQGVEQKLAGQLTGELQTKDVVVSAVGPGEVFGWSGLVPPHKATTSVKATTPCRVIAFNCQELLQAFDDDCRFGYVMMQKTAQIIRDRLRDIRIESLVHAVM
jgi:CRP/FNR family cyclic AMP-dependent transcriptional regulator